MSRKPESVFIGHVHRRLPEHIYVEKQHNMMRGGTPDVYVEGMGRILWYEAKYTFTLPPVLDLTRQTSSPKLSGLQMKWLDRATQHQIPNAVILGWGEGRDRWGFVLEENEWKEPMPREMLLANRLDMQQIADWITEAVT